MTKKWQNIVAVISLITLVAFITVANAEIWICFRF